MSGDHWARCRQFLRLALTWPLWWVRERRRKRELHAYLQEAFEKAFGKPEDRDAWQGRGIGGDTNTWMYRPMSGTPGTAGAARWSRENGE